MQIEVLAEHIEKGRRHDECYCPVALAVRAHYDKMGEDNPLVSLYLTTEDMYIYLWGHQAAEHHRLSYQAQEFIQRFDHGMKVAPCTLTTTRMPPAALHRLTLGEQP